MKIQQCFSLKKITGKVSVFGGLRRFASVAIAATVTEGNCSVSDNILSRQKAPSSEAHYLETAVHIQLEHPKHIMHLHPFPDSWAGAVKAKITID